MNQSAQQAKSNTTTTASGSSSRETRTSEGSRLRESLRGQDFATQEQMLRPTESSAPSGSTRAADTPSTAKEQSNTPSPLETEINAIPPYHVILEQLAHNYAYHSADLSDVEDLKGKSDAKYLEQARLKKIGYERKQVVESAATGFQVTLFMPVIEMRGKSADPASLGLPADLRLRPVLAFRGTDGGPDVADDANPAGIGSFQFAMHEEDIGSLIAKANGSGQGAPDLTGHSLGGALAQRAAARFTGEIHDIVTFQAPGIGADAAKVGKEHASTHYMMFGDLVSAAGGAHTPGTTIMMTQPKNMGPLSHTELPLAAIDDQRTDGRGIDAVRSDARIGIIDSVPSVLKDMGLEEMAYEYVRSKAGIKAMTGQILEQSRMMDLVAQANAAADELARSDDVTPARFESELRKALTILSTEEEFLDQIVRNATLRFERLQKERRH